MRYKKAITYGTFDMFHIGHLKLINKMQDFASEIIVAVSTDDFNAIKGKSCVIPYNQRAMIVSSIVGVSKVIPEETWDQKIVDIKLLNIDCFIIGDDWKGKFDYLKEYCDVIYLPRTNGVSTTEIKEALKSISPTFKQDFNRILDILESMKKELT